LFSWCIMDKLCPCLKKGEEALPEDAAAAAEGAAAEAAAALEKVKQGGLVMHTAIGWVAIANAVALPVMQFLSQRCSGGLLGWIPVIGSWFTDCEVSSHLLHMILAICNLLLVLGLTTVWDPTNEARGSIYKVLTALPSLVARGWASCRETVVSKLPIPGGMQEKLLEGGPRSDDGGEESSDGSEESEDSDDDEEKAGTSAAAAPPPADAKGKPADKKKKSRLLGRSSKEKLPPSGTDKLPAPEKLPAPAPAPAKSPAKGKGKDDNVRQIT